MEDARVSRWHARITRTPGGFAITDLGSGSGTTVNNQPVVGTVPIRPGDVVRLGSLPLNTGAEPLRSIFASAPVLKRAHAGEASHDPVANRAHRLRVKLLVGLSIAMVALVAVVVAVASNKDKPKSSASSATDSLTGEDGEALPRWAFEAVFMVAMERGGKTEPIGTGFVVQDSGYLVTNAHVAEPIATHCLGSSRCIGVVIGNEHPERRFIIRGIKMHPGFAGGTDEFVPDLAVLEVDRPSSLPRGLPLAEASAVNNATLQGKRMAVIGFPGRTMNPADPVATVDVGTVGRVVRDDWIQFSAEITPGNSGSPVLVPGPAVIGVNYAGLGLRAVVTMGADGQPKVERIQQGGGLNMAVGVRLLREYLKDIR